jgi:GlcNAc-P-P-Und epimerase
MINLPDKVLITGATGFLGRYVQNAFLTKGWDVLSLGRSASNRIKSDLSADQPDLEGYSFSRVIHAAGLAHHIPKDKDAAQAFYDVNLEGTENLLLSLQSHAEHINQFVFISSVAVYGLPVGTGIHENRPLEGKSHYAKSKIYAEEQVQSWCEQMGIPYLILRLPIVAGQNAPQTIREMIDKISKGKYLRIGNGSARKSMVLADDIAGHLVEWERISGIFNLTDGHHPSFAELETYLSKRLQFTLPKSMPDWKARVLSGIGDMVPGFKIHSRIYQQFTADLTYDDTKARRELNWSPRRVIDVEWL